MALNPLATQILVSIFTDMLARGDMPPHPPRVEEIGQSEAEFAARKTVEREYSQVHQRMDRVVLMMHAMWSILEEKTNVTDADLLKRLSDLEAATEAPREPIRCSCGAAINRRLHRCLFCGKEYQGAEPFETL